MTASCRAFRFRLLGVLGDCLHTRKKCWAACGAHRNQQRHVHRRFKRACLRRRDPKAWQRFEKTGKRYIHTYTHFPRMLPCSWCWTGLFQSIFDTMCCSCRPRSNGGRPTMTCDNDLDATCFRVRFPVYSLLRTLGMTLEHV